MVVVVEVYENEVKHLHEGQAVVVTSKAFQPPFDAEGLQGQGDADRPDDRLAGAEGVDPFAPADRHVVEVRVELDHDCSRQAATLSNLQVDVRFLRRD